MQDFTWGFGGDQQVLLSDSRQRHPQLWQELVDNNLSIDLTTRLPNLRLLAHDLSDSHEDLLVAIDPGDDDRSEMWGYDGTGEAKAIGTAEAPERSIMVLGYCDVCDDQGVLIPELVGPDGDYKRTDPFEKANDHNGGRWYHEMKICHLFSNGGSNLTTDVKYNWHTKKRWYKSWNFCSIRVIDKLWKL